MALRGADKAVTGSTGRRLCLVVLLLSAGISAPALPDTGTSGWQIDTPFYVSGAAYYQGKGGAALTTEAVAATAELRLASLYRPYAASLFADYRSFPGDAKDVVSLGASFRYRIDRWETKSWVFRSTSRNAPHSWLYAGRIRYSLTQRHKIGIETIGKFDDAGSPTLLLGYYRKLSRSLSVSVAIGSGAGADLAARTELSWQFRQGR